MLSDSSIKRFNADLVLAKETVNHVKILDLLRGIAALLVCTSHLRNAMLVDWNQAVDHGLLQKILYGLTGLGHQSVMIFFVLSGYLVGGSVLTAGAKFNWSDYLIARLCRLWVVLIPCLLLTLAADTLINQYASDVLAGSFATRWHSAPLSGIYSTSWKTLLGNIFFVQTIYVPVFGSNGPLWSLANEFWYYLMFPLSLAFLRNGKFRMGCNSIFSAIFLLSILILLPTEITLGFLVWLLGALVSYLNQKKYHFEVPRIAFVLSIAGVLIGIGFSKWSSSKSWVLPWGDWVLGITVAILLFTTLKVTFKFRLPPSFANFNEKLTRWLSDISFTLYLSHFPLVMLVCSYFFHDANLQPTLVSWLEYCGLLAFLLFAARIIWWFFERNTKKVRWLVTTYI